jgi:porin
MQSDYTDGIIMPAAHTSPVFAAPLAACILTICLATTLRAQTSVLIPMGEDSANIQGDRSGVSRASVSDDAPVLGFGGSFDDRLKLTGDWCGVRDQWACQGITLDTNLTQFYQGVAAGGVDRTFSYGGKLDYLLNIDGDKARLWDGFLVSIHAETRYGKDVNTSEGMFTFGNFNMAFPKAGEDVTGVTKFILSQSLAENLVVFGGKINSLDDFVLEFTGRNGVERFMNSAMVANIINARTVPYSTYGVGVSVLRDQGPSFTFVVRDPDNRPTTLDLDELFENGVLLSGTVKVPVEHFGLPGHQNFGANWNSREFTSVDPASFFDVPGQGIVAGKKSGSWALWYNFDQYLWVSESDPDVGWGIFGMSGISDGDPNPVGWNMTLGVGGSSLIPGRSRDTFGLGYFRVGLSSDFKELLGGPLAPRGLAQHDEQGVELFYNARLTPWCHLSGDMQIVEPSTKIVDTTILTGMRLKIDF